VLTIAPPVKPTQEKRTASPVDVSDQVVERYGRRERENWETTTIRSGESVATDFSDIGTELDSEPGEILVG